MLKKSHVSVVLVFVAIFDITLASVDQCRGKCPAGSPGNDVYLLPHEECNKYCQCVFGRPVEMPCPPGLHYSENDRVCTDPALAGCDQGIKSSLKQISEPSDMKWYADSDENAVDYDCLGECPGWLHDYYDTSVILAHKECRKFCKCDNGELLVQNCPKNLHFSLSFGGCTYPAEANCQGIIDSSENSSDDWCECPVSSTSAESTTIVTVSTTPSLPTESSTIQESTTLVPGDTSGCIGTCSAWDGDDVQHLPHRDCTKFCKCDFGEPHVFDCPKGLHFNPILEVCDRPGHAGCNGNHPTTSSRPTTPSRPTTSPRPTTSSRPPTWTTSAPGDTSGCIGTCSAWDGDDVQHLAHRDCTKFCKCDFGEPYVFDCPKGLHFNAYLQVCDRPSEAGCTGLGGKNDDNENENDIVQKNVMGFNKLFRW